MNHWCSNHWWEDEKTYGSSFYSQEIINNSYNRVLQLFDNEWYYKIKNEEHLIIHYLKIKGLIFMDKVVTLGSDLLVIDKYQHLIGNLFRRLKIHEEYNGARFELKIISELLENGFIIERETNSGKGNKTSDIKVTSNNNNNELYIELKSLSPSIRNKDREELSLRLYFAVEDEIRMFNNNFAIQLDYLPEFKIKSLTKDGFYEIEKNTNTIAKLIAEDIKNNIQKMLWGKHIIKDIASYKLIPDKNVQGEFGGLPLSDEMEADKMLKNAIIEANEQLKNPGVVIINSYYSIQNSSEHEYIINHLIENPESFKNINAVLLMYCSTYNFVPYQIGKLIKNPHCNDVSNNDIVQCLLNMDKKNKEMIKQ